MLSPRGPEDPRVTRRVGHGNLTLPVKKTDHPIGAVVSVGISVPLDRKFPGVVCPADKALLLTVISPLFRSVLLPNLLPGKVKGYQLLRPVCVNGHGIIRTGHLNCAAGRFLTGKGVGKPERSVAGIAPQLALFHAGKGDFCAVRGNVRCVEIGLLVYHKAIDKEKYQIEQDQCPKRMQYMPGFPEPLPQEVPEPIIVFHPDIPSPLHVLEG